jgi:KDO2-lipid IV(A) lauroyltransferase
MSIAHRLEAALVTGLLRGAGNLSPVAASNIAGGVARAIGPLLPVSRVAHANLAATMPELDAAARTRVVRDVWEQLGRTVGELPHLGSLRRGAAEGPGWEVSGEEVLTEMVARGKGCIFFSGHIGNWEMFQPAASQYGIPVGILYRAAQNGLVDDAINQIRARAAGFEPKMFPKGAAGARQTMAHLRAGGYLAVLVDQKLNEGIECPFFGLPAMTSPAAAIFALHFNVPLIPAICRRIGPARLRLEIEPPLPHPNTGNKTENVALLTRAVNDTLERWIREKPGQWLWLHRRWPKDVVKLR